MVKTEKATFYDGSHVDLASFSKQTIYKEDALLFNEDTAYYHHGQAPAENIRGFAFNHCIIFNFPNASDLLKNKPKYYCLKVYNSKLTRITSLDLKGFHQLNYLNLNRNDIEELPGDLFDHTPNLQTVSFCYNKIKVIGENILDPLKDLKAFYLDHNPGIDACYHHSKGGRDGYMNLAQFKEAIKRCKPTQDVWKIIDEQKQKIDALKSSQKKAVDELKKEIEKLKTKVAKLEKGETFTPSDFTVKINGKEFKTQKAFLIANSPFLAQMIQENENADTLELKDISEATFEEILNYMVDKSGPKATANFMELYAASGCLQMKELMELCAKKLIGKVTSENAFEVLCLCKKYPNIELEKKAVDELKKSYEK